MSPQRKTFLINTCINYLILTIIGFIFTLLISWNFDLFSISRIIIAGVIAYFNPLIKNKVVTFKTN